MNDPGTTVPRPQGCALAIVAKLPRPGACKTRLMPAFGPDGAAALSRCFIDDTMQNIGLAARARGAKAVALYAPDADEDTLRDIFGLNCAFVPQRGGDLGERLSLGIDDILRRGYSAVCAIGSDSPTLPTRYLERAVEALARLGDRVVLGPTTDGGYYLIGVKCRHPELFEGVAWSTSAVYAQTLTRAAGIGLEIEALPPWYDVDEEADVSLLEREFEGRGPRHGFAANRTRAFLASWAPRVPHLVRALGQR